MSHKKKKKRTCATGLTSMSCIISFTNLNSTVKWGHFRWEASDSYCGLGLSYVNDTGCLGLNREREKCSVCNWRKVCLWSLGPTAWWNYEVKLWARRPGANPVRRPLLTAGCFGVSNRNSNTLYLCSLYHCAQSLPLKHVKTVWCNGNTAAWEN